MTGKPVDAAQALVTNAGLQASIREVSSDQPAGTVVDQSPAPGGEADCGTTVTLSVSTGPQQTTAPPAATG